MQARLLLLISKTKPAATYKPFRMSSDKCDCPDRKGSKTNLSHALLGRGIYRNPWVSCVTGHFSMTLKERHSFGLRAPSGWDSSACAGTACGASQPFTGSPLNQGAPSAYLAKECRYPSDLIEVIIDPSVDSSRLASVG